MAFSITADFLDLQLSLELISDHIHTSKYLKATSGMVGLRMLCEEDCIMLMGL